MMKRFTSGLKYFVYFFLLYSAAWIEGAVRNGEIELAEYLLANYSKQAKPVIDPNQPVRATFGIEIIQFIKVDDRNQMLTSKVMVRQSWHNMLMRWNSSLWKGVKEIQLDGSLLWAPDIVLYNNADDEFPGGTEKYRTKIITSEDGFTYWLAPATFTSTCSIDIKYFPFDQQECFLKFGSWTFDISGINVSLDHRPLLTEHYVNSSEWDLVGAEKTRNVVKYTCCPNPYVDVTFRILLLRKPLYYVFNVIVPCLVLVTTILFGFFLPPESGERISLTITILLAVAVFLQLISDALPRNSDSIPILAIFYMVIMAESAISLITTCVVLVIHYRNSDKGAVPMPKWVRTLFLVHCANILGIKGNQRVDTTTGGNENDEWSNGETRKNGEKQVRFGATHVIEGAYDNGMQTGFGRGADEVEAFDGTLDDILNEVQFITSSMLKQDSYGEVQEEWKFLAKVLDRLFFWLFLLTVITSTTGILVPVYLIHH